MTTDVDEALLRSISQRVLWLSTAIVDAANRGRPNSSGVKVGGHQASSASMVDIMVALWFSCLTDRDRVSVKPHASPVLHAVNYLLGELDERYLTTLREFGGLQSYPSRSKDPDPVDYSTGSVGIESLVLFLIIFLWTPPHSWALALYTNEDYTRAGVPMLPVASGVAATGRQILIYAMLLAPIGVAPAFLGMASPLYGAIAALLGVIFVGFAWRCARMPASDRAMAPARQLFAYSLLYLFLIFAMLLAGNGLGVTSLAA